MSTITIVLAASIVIAALAAGLIYRKARKNRGVVSVQDAGAKPRPRQKVRFGQFETDQRVAVLGINRFGQLDGRVIGFATIVGRGFESGGRVRVHMNRHPAGVSVRRMAYRLRPVETQ